MSCNLFSLPLQYRTHYSENSVIEILNKNISPDLRIFECKMLVGTIINYELDASIVGPSNGTPYTINSRVYGQIYKNEHSTILDFTVKFGLGQKLICTMFTLLPFIAQVPDSQEIHIFQTVFFSILGAALSYTGMLLKLYWDKSRLEKFLTKHFTT